MGIRAEGEASTGPGAAHRGPCVPCPAPWVPRGQPPPHWGTGSSSPEAPGGCSVRPADLGSHGWKGGPERRPHLGTPGKSSQCPGAFGGLLQGEQKPRKPLRLRQQGRWAGSGMLDGPLGIPALTVPPPLHMATWEPTPKATGQTKPNHPGPGSCPTGHRHAALGSLVSLPRRGRRGREARLAPGLLHRPRAYRTAPVPRAPLVN